MNLKNLSDDSLILNTKILVQKEREIITEILHHLREIERRRLFSKFKYPSLFAYAVGELKYSESQADRRISAMRLLKELPEIEDKITSGELSLSHLVIAQTLFNKERKAGNEFCVTEKIEVLSRLENQSTRSAEKIVGEISPLMKARKAELKFSEIEDDSLREKLLKIKGRMAHQKPNLSLNDLLHLLCDEKIAQLEKSPPAPRVRTNAWSGSDEQGSSARSKAQVRRVVWQKSANKCTNCGSYHALEIDHIVPQAKGGDSSPDNLRLLCRPCNQRAAIEHFGAEKMAQHLR